MGNASFKWSLVQTRRGPGHAPPGRQPKDAAGPGRPGSPAPSDTKAANYIPPGCLSPHTPSNHFCSQWQEAQDHDCELCPLLQDDSRGQTEDTGKSRPCHPGASAAIACPSSPVLQTFYPISSCSHQLPTGVGWGNMASKKTWHSVRWDLPWERGSIASFLRVCTHID